MIAVHKRLTMYSFNFLSDGSRRFLLFFALMLMSCQSFGQDSELDQLEKIIAKEKGDTNEVNARSEMFRLLFAKEPDRGLVQLEKALKLAKKLNYRKGEANCYMRYAIYHTSRGEYDQSLKKLQKAKSIFEELNDAGGINACINGEANVYLDQGNYDKALEQLLKSDQLCEKAGLPDQAAKAKHNISLIYYTLKDLDKALAYLNESLEIKKSLSDSTGMLVSYNGIGAILSAQNKHKEALEIQREALGLARRIGNYPESASILNNMGAQFYYFDQPDSSRYYYREALTIYQKLNMRIKSAEIYSNLGNLECYLKNGRQAVIYYDSCLAIAQEINAQATVAIAYEGLSKAYEIDGDYEAALDWFRKYHFLNDSLVGERVKTNINDLQLKYDASKKDLHIEQLEKSELEAEIAADKVRQIVIILSIVALAIIVSLILFIGRRNARAKQFALSLEQKALRAQMNPHFIFNSLNSIQRMYIEGKEDIANDYMADFSRLLRSILENSGKSVIKLKEELELTTLYLNLEQLRTDKLFDYTITVDEEVDPLTINVPPLIFQPYLENAIWHGIIPKNEHGKIEVNIHLRSEKELIYEIIDDGVGMDNSVKKDTSEKTSKGMAITSERLGGERNVKVESAKGKGTRISLVVEYRK